ncbi:cytochrome c oxidase subunit 2 [Methylocapsa palsarum]|uniref:Cytochrome c oxidase subunit 2 n=2 Tax=Methylocapsa palsarum TaxID=1612308 RepID=A0A1I3XI59_9HYPH|nr:cytochrome c oxidase subunit 2 [Methylocapsa palsarum]
MKTARAAAKITSAAAPYFDTATIFRASRAQLMRTGLSVSAFLASAISAARADGFPTPGQIGFGEAVTPIAHEMHFFHNWILLPIIVGIVIFVFGLLTYVVLRFNEKANPVPAQTTHNSTLEVIWTVAPVMILVIIAIPSFRLLTHQVVVPEADITLKATGKQWYWTYNYPKDQGGGFEFDSYLVPEASLKPGDMRLLTVDNMAVVPVGKTVRLLVTAADVIHSFTIPSFGVRIDAVPGRMNESWFKAEREGTYYGQCSKICGKDHAYMPIVFHVVSQEDYDAWLLEASKKFASNDAGPLRLAYSAAGPAGQR